MDGLFYKNDNLRCQCSSYYIKCRSFPGFWKCFRSEQKNPTEEPLCTAKLPSYFNFLMNWHFHHFHLGTVKAFSEGRRTHMRTRTIFIILVFALPSALDFGNFPFRYRHSWTFSLWRKPNRFFLCAADAALLFTLHLVFSHLAKSPGTRLCIFCWRIFDDAMIAFQLFQGISGVLPGETGDVAAGDVATQVLLRGHLTQLNGSTTFNVPFLAPKAT